MIDPYLITLLLTIVVELTVAAIVTRGDRPVGLLPVVLCANLLTHPIASFLVMAPDPLLGFWLTEALVVGAEILIFRRVAGLGFGLSTKLSLIANSITIAMSWAWIP